MANLAVILFGGYRSGSDSSLIVQGSVLQVLMIAELLLMVVVVLLIRGSALLN